MKRTFLTHHLRLVALSLAAASIPLLACHPPASVVPVAPVVDTAQSPLTLLIGEGRLSAAPEYVEMTIRLQSQCYDTPVAASRATDEASKRVIKILRKAIDVDKSGDGVLAQGGLTRPFSDYSKQSGRAVCVGTFQKRSSIVIKTSRVSEFAEKYGDIQRTIFDSAFAKPARTGMPGLIVTIDPPIARLTHESRERLEIKALSAALGSAKDKFHATAKSACGELGYRIVKFVEREPGTGGRPIPYGAPTKSGSSASALALDDIWINKLLEVHFEIDPSDCRG